MTQLEKLFYSNTNRLSMTITFVFLTIALSYLEIPVGRATISFSSLLVCMMLGTVFCNTSEFSEDIMNRADKWTAPLNAAFFVLSGAELELGVFTHIEYVMIGLVYILARSFGKYIRDIWALPCCRRPESPWACAIRPWPWEERKVPSSAMSPCSAS